MAIPIAAAGAGAHLWNQFTGPQRPDYQGAAQQQSQGSQVGMSGPNGSQQWTTGPDGRPQLMSTYSGPLAQANQQLQQQAAGQGPAPDGMAAREQAFNAYMDQAQSRLDPMFQQREEQLRTQLINQGLDPSSAASGRAMDQFGQQRNDAYSSALNNAVGQSTAAGNAIFQQGLQSQRMPYEQMAMLQALQGQQFGAASGGYQGPQSLAAALGQGNYDLGRWQIENQAIGDAMGAASGATGDLASLIAMFYGGGGK